MSAKVFLKIRLRLFSRCSRSHSCSKDLKRSSIGKRPKFIEPMLSDASSGLKVVAGRMRSSTLMCGLPPVVMLITASVAALIFERKGRNRSGSCDGRPSFGSRACRCRIAAPARAASMDACAISSAVTGRCGDMLGVWMAPVGAQVMMALGRWAMRCPERRSGKERERERMDQLSACVWPSTTSSWPVTLAARSLAANSTMFAMSVAVTMRPSAAWAV
ncbi:hypothetical protein FQZ97_729450 [compost metagenome]